MDFSNMEVTIDHIAFLINGNTPVSITIKSKSHIQLLISDKLL